MIKYEISASTNTLKKAEAIVAALALLNVRAVYTETGPLGELLEADEERTRKVRREARPS